ncbi:MAG TPA: fused MFS/spermidine synthase, partial [Candidatus Deferrimicrobiaceae bacterium]
LYSHLLIRRFPPRGQAALHLALLLASLCFLPVLPSPSWKPSGAENPVARILGLLAATVGLPYLLLSATSPLVSAWCARRSRGEIPYRLYALSNAGSMLGLLSYPVGVEPFLDSTRQAYSWSAGYAAFVCLCGAAAIRSRNDPAPTGPLRNEPSEDPSPGVRKCLLWVTLAACGAALLLSFTGHMTQNVAAIPFLWMLPLSVYLLSFILCFAEGERYYRRPVFLALLPAAFAGCGWLLRAGVDFRNLPVSVSAFTVALFLFCMFCHGELAAGKPAPAHLTVFYLMISLGGALGGAFVGLAAPFLFPGLVEIHASLLALAVLATFLLVLEARAATGPFWRRAALPCAALLLSTGLAVFVGNEIRGMFRYARVSVRNFYGALRVTDVSAEDGRGIVRKLTHGVINHGVQYLEPGLRGKPTTYYGPGSGVGLALAATRDGAPHRVGVIGLGTGTLAAYGRPGDQYRFYEIDPNVERLSREEFRYLPDSRASVTVVLGDARLSLEREPPARFDLLVVDAFTSDAIPVHLLTREAFALYFRHLSDNGVLAVHVSNKYLDLKPVVRLSAEALGKEARLVDTQDDPEDVNVFGATWVLATGRQGFFDGGPLSSATAIPARPGQRVWTDGYSNLFRALK